jgi:hypothetical protein
MSMLGDNIRRLRRPETADAAPGRRWKTNWPAELVSPAGRVPCTVLDISSWGAQLRFDGTVVAAAKSRVWLNIECVGTIGADIVWRRDNVLGLQFLEQQAWIRRMHTHRLDPTTWHPAAGYQPLS